MLLDKRLTAAAVGLVCVATTVAGQDPEEQFRSLASGHRWCELREDLLKHGDGFTLGLSTMTLQGD